MASVRDFGARGDGSTDDTQAIVHAIQKGDGLVVFPRGDYLITRPVVVPLETFGRLALTGSGGGARLLMAGAGPALHLIGTHARTAQPDNFLEKVWIRERMPTVRDLEIVGKHAEADGIRLEGVMQPTLTGLLIRRCRYAVHLTKRDRNVLLADSHIYDCSGVGVFLDRVNLHQINITGNHISYCKQGGIKIVGSEVRNIQIVGNDIEYNFDLKAETSADVCFDCRDGTVREGTIVGNTIQASFSPGGAVVRLIGVGKSDSSAVGLLAITGNLIGSEKTLLDLHACRGVVISGNSLYSGQEHAIFAADSEHLVIDGNSLDHNPQYKGKSSDRIVLRNCRNVNITGMMIEHTREAAGPDEASIELDGCRNINVVGCQVLGVRRRGIWLRGSSVVRVADCTIRPAEGSADYKVAVGADAACRHVMIVNNFLGKGSEGDLLLPATSGTASGNVTL